MGDDSHLWRDCLLCHPLKLQGLHKANQDESSGNRTEMVLNLGWDAKGNKGKECSGNRRVVKTPIMRTYGR